MELYVLRHGEAGKRLQDNVRDSQRSLTQAGKKEMMQVAKGISMLGIKLDLIATSPLKRAYQTAAIVAKELDIKRAKMVEWDELNPQGKREATYQRLAQLKQESSVMVVGHEPYLSTLVAETVFGSGTPGMVVLKKAGLARISIQSFQPKITGELKWLLTPKHLKRVA